MSCVRRWRKRVCLSLNSVSILLLCDYCVHATAVFHAYLCSADLYMQRRFLRARNHDVAKAKAMFMAHISWRKEFCVDELDQFVFHERDAIISLYPQGYHKMDKLVSLGVFMI